MARNKNTENATETEHPTPGAGGSYMRDSETGELTLIERTEIGSAVDDSEIPFDNTQE